MLDVKLPDMFGWDICKRIKENPITASIMVLELSATLATAEDRARGLELGADAYLVHPVEIVELVATLRALYRLRQAERERERHRELFLGTVGHDLRNPLQTIVTATQVLTASQTLTTARAQDRRDDRAHRRPDAAVDRPAADVQPGRRRRRAGPSRAGRSRRAVPRGGARACRRSRDDRDRGSARGRGRARRRAHDPAGRQPDHQRAPLRHRHGHDRLARDADHAVLTVHNHGTPIDAGQARHAVRSLQARRDRRTAVSASGCTSSSRSLARTAAR